MTCKIQYRNTNTEIERAWEAYQKEWKPGVPAVEYTGFVAGYQAALAAQRSRPLPVAPLQDWRGGDEVWYIENIGPRGELCRPYVCCGTVQVIFPGLGGSPARLAINAGADVVGRVVTVCYRTQDEALAACYPAAGA